MTERLSQRLADRLAKMEKVLDSFRLAHLLLVGSKLPSSVEAVEFREPNWGQLLTWASVFAQSEHEHHVELALVASIAALRYQEEDLSSSRLRTAASSLLELCSNNPSLELARRRGLLEEGSTSNEIGALLRNYQRRFRHFLFDTDEANIISITDFQDRTWEALTTEMHIALSAPTSAGKSFILTLWLRQLAASSAGDAVFAYVVPSRALINQVSQDLAAIFRQRQIAVGIVTLPSLVEAKRKRPTVLVMTQERTERLFSALGDLSLDALIVDEAHKLGEGPRGVILQRTIDEALARNPSCKVILAAPHVSNAEVLLPRPNLAIGCVITESRPTVLQNLFWLSPVLRRGGAWQIQLVHEAESIDVGQFRLPTKPTGKKKQLAAIVNLLCAGEKGNVVFANGAGEAEEIALLLADHQDLGTRQPRAVAPEVLELADLVESKIHSDYPLAKTLRHGIGIHYGDMPEIARRDQERLFGSGELATLVCTSTLLEGVNLPCRNLFIWGPRQGNTNPMSLHAFWNLAGRAGRWGKEFAGNIFCVNVHDTKQWPSGPPRKRFAQPVGHSGSEVISKLSSFRSYALERQAPKTNRYFEQVLGELVTTRLADRDLDSIGWGNQISEKDRAQLREIADRVMSSLDAPSALLRKHPGISPSAVSDFLTYLRSRPLEEVDRLLPMTPDLPDAVAVLEDNLRLCDLYLGSAFGNKRTRFFKANLTLSWIRGEPLGRIIRDRLKYLASNDRRFKVPTEIRAVIKLINENARFLVPKYLSCYADCVSTWLRELGQDELAADYQDIQDMLEVGVSERTMISLIGLGFSRISAVEIAQRIPDTSLSPIGVVEWLRNRTLAVYNISPVIIRESNRILESCELT